MSSARFSLSHGIIPLVIDGDWNAGFSADSFDMSNYNHATIIIIGDDSITNNGVITVMAGTSDAAETAAVTFAYRYSGADVDSALSDVYGVVATTASLTTTVASVKNQTTILEFDATDLLISGVQYRYVTVVVDSSGGAGTVSMVAILSEPRYQKEIMPTANPA